jgi:S1-C subfamily serine protease
VLGIVGGTVTSELNEEKQLGTVDGVYVSEVVADGAAAAAGIKEGDVIVGLDGKSVKSMAQMQEMLTMHVPGDLVSVKILRDKNEKELKVELKNIQGNTSVVKSVDLDILGAEFKELGDKEMKNYNIPYGLKVTSVSKGLLSKAGISEGFVIVKVNGTAMKSIEDLNKVVKAANASTEPVLFVVGVTPSGRKAYFSVDLSQN